MTNSRPEAKMKPVSKSDKPPKPEEAKARKQTTTTTTTNGNGVSAKVANGATPSTNTKKTDHQSTTLGAGYILVPVFLMTFTPNMVMVMWYTNLHFGGSLLKMLEFALQEGFVATWWKVWGPVMFGSPLAWTILAVFASVQIAMMLLLPGEVIYGPLTPRGHIPKYKSHGFLSFVLTVTMFFLSTSVLKLFPATIIYDNFGELLGALNLFSLIFCGVLYIKGHLWPTSLDVGASGNILFDYYWGVELYPRIFGVDVKWFTNCRFGMMSWSIILFSFAAKQQELYGAISPGMYVSVGLQVLYCAKFFVWEAGYFCSMDIMHDRAGYMICWGCLVWVPSIYTSPGLYLVHNQPHMSVTVAWAVFIVGAASVLINYWADYQRQHVRLTQGKCTIWGRPPRMVSASYISHDGKPKSSLLLTSGWWGLSRHFHYLPELLGTFCWTVPALFENVLPYFYFVFLTVLLMHRLFRHEERCATKYGTYWNQYCKLVPYKLIPFVF